MGNGKRSMLCQQRIAQQRLARQPSRLSLHRSTSLLTDSTRPRRRSMATDSHRLRPIVLFGPSGSGKSTLIKKFQTSPEWANFAFSVSHTTRKPRTGEADGVAYHFVSREQFDAMVQKGEFIEHAQFGGNCYGTSLGAVSAVSEDQKKRCILDIDAQGVKLILKNHPNLNPLIIFICPPSLSELQSRLEARGTESKESMQSRLAMSQSEIDYAKSGSPHLVIVNNDLEQAYQKFHAACTVDLNQQPNQLPQSDPFPF